MLIGIIGLGEIAKKAYLPILTSMEGIELVICSRSQGIVAQIQNQYRIPRATTHLDDLFRMGIQAAFVLTPSETHVSITTELLKHKVDVFLEKPATLHSSETQVLSELADANGQVLMIGFNRRYAPLHIRAHQIWQEQTIGMALFQKYRTSASHPHLEHQFRDDTIHLIDLARFFCGEGEVVNTVQYITPDRLLGAASTIALDRGGYAMVITGLQAGRWQETYTLHGSGHSLIVDAFTRLRMIGNQEELVQEETYASSWITTLEGRGFNGQINHFLECVNRRSLPFTSGWDSVKTQQLVEQMVAGVTHTHL
ncbi:MAG TPA: Gfo/Idh/MocA family oxidoreductase [Anaerolineaceae bacterium]|jgi:virulence factor